MFLEFFCFTFDKFSFERPHSSTPPRRVNTPPSYRSVTDCRLLHPVIKAFTGLSSAITKTTTDQKNRFTSSLWNRRPRLFSSRHLVSLMLCSSSSSPCFFFFLQLWPLLSVRNRRRNQKVLIFSGQRAQKWKEFRPWIAGFCESQSGVLGGSACKCFSSVYLNQKC